MLPIAGLALKLAAPYAVRGLVSMLGKKRPSAATGAAGDPRAAMLRQITGETSGPLDASPTYQAGLAQLRQQATDAAAANAGAFARRGMAGGEAELAARAAQGQALAAGQTGLLQTAASDRAQKLQMLAGLAGQMEAEKLAEKQRRAGLWGAAGSVVGQALTAYATLKAGKH